MNRIREIDDETLATLVDRIKPVIRKKENLYYIKPVDPRKTAYLWDPKTTKKAKGLEQLTDIRTYHTFGYYGFFKPSIYEVIAAIPEELLLRVVAFELIDKPETREDLGKEWDLINEGYQVATARLYTKS